MVWKFDQSCGIHKTPVDMAPALKKLGFLLWIHCTSAGTLFYMTRPTNATTAYLRVLHRPELRTVPCLYP